jgi:hypothetical protein
LRQILQSRPHKNAKQLTNPNWEMSALPACPFENWMDAGIKSW